VDHGFLRSTASQDAAGFFVNDLLSVRVDLVPFPQSPHRRACRPLSGHPSTLLFLLPSSPSSMGGNGTAGGGTDGDTKAAFL